MKINLYRKRRSSPARTAGAKAEVSKEEASTVSAIDAGTISSGRDGIKSTTSTRVLGATGEANPPAPRAAVAVLAPAESEKADAVFIPPPYVPKFAVVDLAKAEVAKLPEDAGSDPIPAPSQASEPAETTPWKDFIVLGGSVLVCVSVVQPTLVAFNNGSPMTLELAYAVALVALGVFFAAAVKVVWSARSAIAGKTSLRTVLALFGRSWPRTAPLGTAIGLGILAAGGIRHPFQPLEDVEGTILRRSGDAIAGLSVSLPERSGLAAVPTSHDGGFLFRGVAGHVRKLRVMWDGQPVDFPRSPGGEYRVIPDEVLAVEPKWTSAPVRWTSSGPDGAGPPPLAEAGFSNTVLYEGHIPLAPLPTEGTSDVALMVRVSLRPYEASDFRIAAVSSNMDRFEGQRLDGSEGYFGAEFSPGDLPSALFAWRQLELSDPAKRSRLLGTVEDDRLCMTLFLRGHEAVAAARKGLVLRVRLASRKKMPPGPVIPPVIIETSPSATN